MDIELRSQDRVKLIKLRGKLGLGDPVDRLRETLDDLISAGETRIVLDLTDVPIVDSSGIGLLVRTLTSIKQQGGAIRLLKPSKFTLQTLKMIGLINLFEIFDDPQQAMSSFN